MLKKIAALLLACCLFALLSACSAVGIGSAGALNQEKAFAIYETVSNPMSTDQQIDADFRAIVSLILPLSSSSFEQTMELTGNIKCKLENEKTQAAMTMQMSGSLAELSSAELYFDGEKGWLILDGEAQPLDLSALNAEMASLGGLPQLGEDAIKSYDTEKDGSDTIVSLVFDAGFLSDYLNRSGTATDLFGNMSSFSLEDMTVTMVLDRNHIPKTIHMQLEMSTDGVTANRLMTMSMSYEYTVNHYGSGVEIDFPAFD